jgi:hypothetical protein
MWVSEEGLGKVLGKNVDQMSEGMLKVEEVRCGEEMCALGKQEMNGKLDLSKIHESMGTSGALCICTV